MGWFDKKPAEPINTEPTAEEKAAAARAALLTKLEKALTTEAAFMVMTVDNLAWICPYTLTRIASPFGYLEPAKEHLLRTQPWTKLKPRALADLQVIRWIMWLKEHMEFETQLRIFGPDGRWLNPFNGLWVRLKTRSQVIGQELLQEVAEALARCPEAQKGVMLDKYRIEEAQRQTRFSSQHSTQPMDTGSHGTVKVSGSRASSESGRMAKESSLPGLDEDMDKAERIIAKMLAPLPSIDGFGFTVYYEPHSQVGGDFYECKEIAPGKFFIALADVTGHGVQGAMVVVGALKALRFILKQEKDLITILTKLNDEVKQDLLSGQFITMFAAVLDVETRTLTHVCAGHHPSFLLSMNRKVVCEKIGNKGPALGLMGGEIFKRALKPTSIVLEPGDTVIMYTDGLTEVHNARNVEYGDFRLIGTLLGNIESHYDEVVSAAVADARNYAAGVLEDDVTVMSLSIEMPKEEEEQPEAGKPA
jgi:serine phosphatase RsbU (regulator of sigma subunit)